MRLEAASWLFTGLLLTSPLVQAAEHPSTVSRCFANAASPVTAYASAKGNATMPVDARYRAPASSPHLDTLDVLAIGLSLDVFRQGQAWKALQEQSAKQTNVLHVGSILPTDPKQYPVDGDDKDMAYDKRKADALELGLRNFMEKWPIPTITVVRGWNPDTPNLRYSRKEPGKCSRTWSTVTARKQAFTGIACATCKMAWSAATLPKAWWTICSICSNRTLTSPLSWSTT